MKPIVLRDQLDGMYRQDAVSHAAGTDCSTMESMTREEFAEDTKVDTILRRYGVIPPSQRELQFADVDYDVDFLRGINASREAADAWSKIPAEVRAHYRDWMGLVNAMERGELKFGPPKVAEKRADAPPAEPAA